MSGFVYRWYDSSNGMYYVGSHKGSVDDSYKGSGKRFKRAYKKRPECFTREVFYIGEHYLELEEFILCELDAENNPEYYNLKNAAVGGATRTGMKNKPEATAKTAAARRGTKMSEEQKEKLRKISTGKKHSEESKRKMSLSRTGEKNHFYGKKHSKDSLIKMSESKKGKYIGDDAMKNAWNASKKRVYCEHLDREFDSIRECADAVGLSAAVVSNMIAGRQRNRYGIIKI